MAGWWGFASESYPAPKRGEAICKKCGEHFQTDAFGLQVATDMAGRFWYIGTCPTCADPSAARSESHKALKDLLDEVTKQEAWARTEDHVDQVIAAEEIRERKKRERGA